MPVTISSRPWPLRVRILQKTHKAVEVRRDWVQVFISPNVVAPRGLPIPKHHRAGGSAKVQAQVVAQTRARDGQNTLRQYVAEFSQSGIQVFSGYRRPEPEERLDFPNGLSGNPTIGKNGGMGWPPLFLRRNAQYEAGSSSR